MNPEMIRGDSHTIKFNSEVALSGSEYVLTLSRSADPDDQKYTLFSKNGTISNKQSTAFSCFIHVGSHSLKVMSNIQ